MKNIDITNIPDIKCDPLRYCLQNNMIQDSGLWAEFGVWKGQTLDLISQYTQNDIYGFDTFSGVEVEWGGNIVVNDMKHFDIGGTPPVSVVPVDPLLRNGKNIGKEKMFNSNVNFVCGLFEDTLPIFIKKHRENISFMHIDCDVYESTKTIFDNCKDFISSGCVIVFDEFVNYPGYEMHEIKAFSEFICENKINFEWIGMNGRLLTELELNNIGDYRSISIEKQEWIRNNVPVSVALRII